MSDYINKKNFFVNLFLTIIIFSLDRFSKFYVISQSETNLFISQFLNINLIWNDGIAFGLFSFEKEIYYNVLTGIIILITFIIFWMITKTEKLEKIAFIMIFGGSLGNIFDRLYYKSVPDFIDIHFNNFHWFIFNVADIFITLGILFLISIEIFNNKKVKNENY